MIPLWFSIALPTTGAGLLCILVAGLTLAIHAPLTLKTILLARDDRWLTAPLKDVHDFRSWWELIRTGNLPDFQPLRDLSYWIDWRISEVIGSGPYFHFTNLLIWWGILALVWRISAKAMNRSTNAPAWIVVLMALHPVAVEPVAWVSGRKHLLSVLFMLGATIQLMSATKRRKITCLQSAAIVTMFLACCMSQPINILWPAWATLYIVANCEQDWIRANRASLALLFAGLAVCSTATFMINMTVYQGTTWFGFKLSPHAELYGQKIGGLRSDEIGISLLALGRYFFNLILPVKIAHRYAPGTFANLAGLLMIPVVAWAGWRLDETRRAFFLWALHATLPLLVVTLQLSQIFVADSYALSAMPGFMIAAAILVTNIKIDMRRIRYFAVAVCGMLLANSMAIARSWTATDKLWFRADEVEETADSIYFTGTYLLKSGQNDEALARAMRLIDVSGMNPKAIRLVAFSICDHPRLTPQEKRAHFDRLEINDMPPVLDCLAGMHESRGEYDDAARIIIDIARKDPVYLQAEMASGMERLRKSCAQAATNKSQCDLVLRALGKKEVQDGN